MRVAFPLAILGSGLAATPLMAADLSVTFQVPQLTVAEYHRPYIAIWLEKADATAAGDLAVLYDVKKADSEGEKWLKDMRQWWRKSGRNLTLPVDGVSGATKAPGTHTMNFGASKAVKALQPGAYTLVIEAAREVGGREMVKLPLQWPPAGAATESAKGSSELGAVSLAAKP